MEPKIAVVILNWNGREDTDACLRSLRAIDYRNYRVILVDNASTDGSADAIQAGFPEVMLLRNSVNLGFDGGNNLGIRAALREGADAIFLLNNDTVVDSGVLRLLSDASCSLPRAGILGPKICYFGEPKLLWWVGCEKRYSLTGWLLNYTQNGKKRIDHGQYDDVKRVDAVIGCAMYIRREVFEDIGFFDERFFIYHEEFDFCQRAREAGWNCYLIPGAKVWHKISMSMGGGYSPPVCYLWTRNWLLLSRKQTPRRFWPLFYYYYVRECYWIYQGLKEQGKEDSAEATLAGIVAALRNRFGPPPATFAPPAWLSRLASWHCRRKMAGRRDSPTRERDR